jgi:hypothetical protein
MVAVGFEWFGLASEFDKSLIDIDHRTGVV